MSEYLAIKNWPKFQSLRRSGKWIKDYTAQDDEPELARLTMFQRGVYQEIRRIRGRTGKNIPYDIEFILCAMSARSLDRPNIPSAIALLVSCGLLIVTDQRVDVVKTSEKEKEKEKEKENKPSASAKPRGTLPEQGKVSKATGESRHHRVEQIVKGWYRDWVGVECPWDGSEAGQLSRMLKAWPNQPDQQFVTCLEHLARSDCIPKGDRPREWLGKLPKFIQGPLDQYWKPKGVSNGAGTRKTTGQERAARNIQALVLSSMGEGLPRTDVPDGGTVQHGAVNQDRGNRQDNSLANGEVLAREPERPKPK